jgi:hypothetical protein
MDPAQAGFLLFFDSRKSPCLRRKMIGITVAGKICLRYSDNTWQAPHDAIAGRHKGNRLLFNEMII